MGANSSIIEEYSSETVFSFKVDKVKVCEKDPPLQTAQKILQETIPDPGKLEDFSHRQKTGKCFVESPFAGRGVSGFLFALHTAFQYHYPLKLSVSDFIILIGQGLGQHIEKHAEDLGEYFASHQRKEKIKIHRDNFVMGEQNDWSTIFGEFGEEIKKRVKTDIYDIVVDDTSVATPISRIISEITLMDCMEHEYEYSICTFCGFPSITLEGTTEDWKKLRDKYRKLVEMSKDDCMKLDFWLKHLTPVIEKICETGINRKGDTSFWSSIYKYSGPKGSGDLYITGWCTVFFPYLVENRVNTFKSKKLDRRDIPEQISKVSFIWKNLETEIPMNFYGGFIGAYYEKKTKTVSPSHFWCVAHDVGKTGESL